MYSVTWKRVRVTTAAQKIISIAYSETVSVAAGTWREMRMHRIVICCLFDSSMFFHII